MYHITIISTEHKESGKYNSDELYKIIELINPDVIFEEEHNDDKYFEYYSNPNSFNSLEIQAIIKYKQNHDIIHIPVDKWINEFISFRVLDFLTNKFRSHNNYKQIIKEHCLLRDNYGIEYLNSDKCCELFLKIKLEEEQIILNSGPEKHHLEYYYNLFHQELDSREHAMLKNIYSYSSENKYGKAIFFLGFAHRKSIRQKILEFSQQVNPIINWSFYEGAY
ncbi:hypothetical protein V1387_00155 [Allomuricauda taeanensis]|uniref:hypothetical protein n=1 Tax=Flagellimonas taeanensis TaxID=1005926 RepID=UPI002E7B1DA7|nr:hypothetical protein [Allomuricauda taeanensis]MEE1961074.1 hypothetical protein [Allomuricauda taeanensis]